MALHLKSTGIDFTDFGNTSSGGDAMVSELLDDYEEGTWTPVWNSPLNVETNYASRYIKIGNMVQNTSYHSTDDSDSGSGLASASGNFPFTQGVNMYTNYVLNRSGGNHSSAVIFGRQSAGGTDAFYWDQTGGNQTAATIARAAEGASHQIYINFTHIH